MTPSTVSKLMSRLEARLGVRLVERSTRRLSLTAEGQTYYERSQALLAELDDVEHELAQGGGQTSGTIRVNASVAFGTLVLEPQLPSFRRDAGVRAGRAGRPIPTSPSIFLSRTKS